MKNKDQAVDWLTIDSKPRREIKCVTTKPQWKLEQFLFLSQDGKAITEEITNKSRMQQARRHKRKTLL